MKREIKHAFCAIFIFQTRSSFQLFHDLVTMFNISVDEYFYPAKNVEKNTARRQIDSSLDLLSDNELKIIQGTIDGILNSRENKK